MDIQIHNSNPSPIYHQIARQLREQIADGRLKAGDALPSIRLLAKELRISVITTKRAYQELEDMGLIETVAGKGSFVAGANVDFLREEKLRQMEDYLAQGVALSRACGVDKEELLEIMNLLLDKEMEV